MWRVDACGASAFEVSGMYFRAPFFVLSVLFIGTLAVKSLIASIIHIYIYI